MAVWVVSLSTTHFITRRLTPLITHRVFGVWQGLVPRDAALAQSVLYPPMLRQEAIPKYISERTSYHEVWLAFHPYPQVIPTLFNVYGFGPPLALTPASTCSWIDHFVSGLQHMTNAPYSGSLSLRLRVSLTSPYTTTRRLIMQKAVHHTDTS